MTLKTPERVKEIFPVLKWSAALYWNIKFNSLNGYVNPTESLRETFGHMH